MRVRLLGLVVVVSTILLFATLAASAADGPQTSWNVFTLPNPQVTPNWRTYAPAACQADPDSCAKDNRFWEQIPPKIATKRTVPCSALMRPFPAPVCTPYAVVLTSYVSLYVPSAPESRAPGNVPVQSRPQFLGWHSNQCQLHPLRMARRIYRSLAYASFASFSMGMSGSALSQSLRKSR